MTHNELINLLNDYLTRNHHISIPNQHLGSSWLGTIGTHGIADVFSFSTHYRRPDIVIYEVKSNRSDLLQDIKKEKWKKYIPFCNRVVFVCEYGIATISDIPAEAGLKTYHKDKKTFKTVRRGRYHDCVIDFETCMSIILKYKTQVDLIKAKKNFISKWNSGEETGRWDGKKIFSGEVAEALREMPYLREQIKSKDIEFAALADKYFETVGKHWWQ